MTNQTKIRRIVLRICVILPALLFLLILGVVLYLSTIGFPDRLVQAVTKRVSAGNFVLNADSMRLVPLRELDLRMPTCLMAYLDRRTYF